jgi:hypothetical protein
MVEPVVSGKGPEGALKIGILIGEENCPFDPTFYLKDYDWEMHILNRFNSVRVVQELVKRDFDVFLNLCDASWDKPCPGPEVIKVLELAGVAFTGADSLFYDPSREDMKRVCRYYGISTPLSVEAQDEADIERAAATLRFPLIVKMVNSAASIGMQRESRVETFTALSEQAKRFIREYGGALIEEFIEGDEFTVLVVENPDDRYQPCVYRPIQYIFPPGESFKHYEMKWLLWEQMKEIPCQDALLEKRLMEAAGKFFAGLNGVSFGRCDMRVNAGGEIFILEMNPNCALFYPIEEPGSADFVLLNDPQGHGGFLERIFKAALARQKRLHSKWFIRYDPLRGNCLYARQEIAAGEVIVPFEKHPHTLVSRSNIQQTLDPERQRLLARHAYPLTDEVWVMPGENPAGWIPINHSCDPNAWWNGLDITARRKISALDEITLDYATFYNELMPEFACFCDAPDCRKIICGTDYLQPFVEKYAGHVSDYVKQKRIGQGESPQRSG